MIIFNIDDLFDLNYLGHNFIVIRSSGLFRCNNCKCIASYYLHVPISDYSNMVCQKYNNNKYEWHKLLSCEENIIKNIIE